MVWLGFVAKVGDDGSSDSFITPPRSQAASQPRRSSSHVPNVVVAIAAALCFMSIGIKSSLNSLPFASTHSFEKVQNGGKNLIYGMSSVSESVNTSRTEMAPSGIALKPHNQQEKPLQNATARFLNIVHVSSFYKVDNCDNRFCPYDQHQAVALASMLRARQESEKANVTLAASVFPEDGEILPKEFVRLKDLSRSIATEYPLLNFSKNLPFVNDIFDNLRSSQNYHSFDYVIYTNSDIIVRNNFYDAIAAAVRNGYDGFIINRRTVSNLKSGKGGGKVALYTAKDLDSIYNLSGQVHPGSDCFVMKRDIFDSIKMGDIFLGYPPVGNVLLVQVQSLAKKFRHFSTNDLNVTYHFGDAKKWKREDISNHKYHFLNHKNSYNLREVWPEICEFRVESDANLTGLQAGKSKHMSNYSSCSQLAFQFLNNGFDPCMLAKCTKVNSNATSKN